MGVKTNTFAQARFNAASRDKIDFMKKIESSVTRVIGNRLRHAGVRCGGWSTKIFLLMVVFVPGGEVLLR